MKKILVLFKTHLDVGFTDFSRNVIEKYNKIYIPQAIRVAKKLAELRCSEGFVRTAGSRIIDWHRRMASEAELADFENHTRESLRSVRGNENYQRMENRGWNRKPVLRTL